MVPRKVGHRSAGDGSQVSDAVKFVVFDKSQGAKSMMLLGWFEWVGGGVD